MTLRTCIHEREIRQLLERGQWPQSAPPELRSHVDACRACSDMAAVTQAFRSARTVSANAAILPSPGVLWWRAQLRRRNEAVERINRPILGAQIFAMAITTAIAVALAISQARHGLHWLTGFGDWLVSLPQSPAFHLRSLWSTWSTWSVWATLSNGSSKPDVSLVYLIPGVAILALLSGVVVYLASEKQ
jgi:hypothetical protein